MSRQVLLMSPASRGKQKGKSKVGEGANKQEVESNVKKLFRPEGNKNSDTPKPIAAPKDMKLPAICGWLVLKKPDMFAKPKDGEQERFTSGRQLASLFQERQNRLIRPDLSPKKRPVYPTKSQESKQDAGVGVQELKKRLEWRSYSILSTTSSEGRKGSAGFKNSMKTSKAGVSFRELPSASQTVAGSSRVFGDLKKSVDMFDEAGPRSSRPGSAKMSKMGSMGILNRRSRTGSMTEDELIACQLEKVLCCELNDNDEVWGEPWRFKAKPPVMNARNRRPPWLKYTKRYRNQLLSPPTVLVEDSTIVLPKI